MDRGEQASHVFVEGVVSGEPPCKDIDPSGGCLKVDFCG